MTIRTLHADADTGVIHPTWLDADRQTLVDEASCHVGACDEGDLDPGDLEWSLVVDLPVSVLTPLIKDWRAWFDEELEIFDCEHPGRAQEYRDLMHQPLEDPIVVTIEPERVQIWDGWHRTATRILMPVPTIPAIVGIVPAGPSLRSMLGLPGE